MFVGHFAVAFAAKRAEPKLSLPLLFAAVQLADILWPIFVLVGIERSRIAPGVTAVSPLDLQHIPYSHSLVMLIVWGVLLALPWLVRRDFRAGLIVIGCVFSHFVLDWITHRPDMPIAPGVEQRYGLGLWNAVVPTIAIEGTLFAIGVWLYVGGTRATSRMGSVGLATLVVLLTAMWLASIFGPPPPSIEMATSSVLILIPVVLLWAWRIDRGRAPIGAAATAITP